MANFSTIIPELVPSTPLLISVFAPTAFLWLIVRVWFWHRQCSSSKAPPCVQEDYPFLGAWSFWTCRWTFFQRSMARSLTGNFSFFIGKYPVVGLSGEASRRVFFDSKQFGLTEGYGVLFGMFPSTKVKNAQGDDTFITVEFATYFKERIMRMVRKEAVERNLPILISDIRARLAEIGGPHPSSTSITDPFDSIYKLIYLLTMRTVGCVEIARDRQLLDTTLEYYETVARSATASVILFPWFPSVNLIKRYICGAQLYFTFNRIVSRRKKSGERHEDPLQEMVDRGDQTGHIIGVLFGSLFAAQQNSGINAAWILLHLAHSPHWAARVRAEIDVVLHQHLHARENEPFIPLTERLAKLPLTVWESGFQTIDLCLRESIRLHALGACFRQNISERDVMLGKRSGEVVPAKVFASYHMNDIHLNASIYPDPLRWDPARYLPDRAEDKKVDRAWLGWGCGRHPCLGTKFARLEQKLLVAFFFATFSHFSLCDVDGRDVDQLPEIDLQAYSSWKPQQSIYLKMARTEAAGEAMQ